MDAFLYGIYRIQFKCKLCKDNNICYENFYHILFHSSWMPSFTELIEFNLNVNIGKTITFVMNIFIIFLFQSSGMTSFTVFYRIQFKCKLCKYSNICYDNFHHISVPLFMDAFFYGIYGI